MVVYNPDDIRFEELSRYKPLKDYSCEMCGEMDSLRTSAYYYEEANKNICGRCYKSVKGVNNNGRTS